MPAFWVGVMLLLLIALPTGWFPAGGFGESPREHLQSVILPALTLAIGMAPVPIRSLRASVIAILATDYVATARSLGIPGGRIIRRFVLRNAAVPFITVFALEIGFLLFGTAVVETTFALPGVGQGLVLVARGRDLPAIQGYTLLFATLAVVVYLLADILTALLDPCVDEPGYDFNFCKSAPSIFFLTPLIAFLTKQSVDTVLITGCTTSGCVRASIVDASSYGYRVMVPEDCCGDAERGPHDSNLSDVGRRYANITDAREMMRYLAGLS